MSAEIIHFQRFQNMKGWTISQMRIWLKEQGWRNVRFDTRDLDNIIAERLPDSGSRQGS